MPISLEQLHQYSSDEKKATSPDFVIESRKETPKEVNGETKTDRAVRSFFEGDQRQPDVEIPEVINSPSELTSEVATTEKEASSPMTSDIEYVPSPEGKTNLAPPAETEAEKAEAIARLQEDVINGNFDGKITSASPTARNNNIEVMKGKAEIVEEPVTEVTGKSEETETIAPGAATETTTVENPELVVDTVDSQNDEKFSDQEGEEETEGGREETVKKAEKSEVTDSWKERETDLEGNEVSNVSLKEESSEVERESPEPPASEELTDLSEIRRRRERMEILQQLKEIDESLIKTEQKLSRMVA